MTPKTKPITLAELDAKLAAAGLADPWDELIALAADKGTPPALRAKVLAQLARERDRLRRIEHEDNFLLPAP